LEDCLQRLARRSTIITPAKLTRPPPDRRRIRFLLRRVPLLLALCAMVAAAAAAAAPAGSARASHERSGASSQREYSPTQIVVGYGPSQPTARAGAARVFDTARLEGEPSRTGLLRVPHGASLAATLRRVRSERGVEWAVPDYVAHIAGGPYGEFIPNNRGTGKEAGDWRELQWNFVGLYGVEAPEAWGNLIHDGRPGGQGVVVAVLDTGVAYATRGRWRRSPGFGRYQFVKGYDFIAKDPYPYDRNGHGTFVAATIAEQTDRGYGLTGLAYGARIMPVRVLDAQGEGEASTIAEGVYFAVKHHAQVINLSLEFSPGVTASDIPELIQALRYAHRHNVLVVAAAGNEGHRAIAYPARAANVVSVGATTEHGCLAAYSNDGAGLTLVAPGGGPDAYLPGDPNCHPELPSGRDVFQVTLTGEGPRSFGIPSGYEGTSMATPHVAATAALVIASGVLGPHPTPAQIVARLRATARKLGGGGDEALYGAGLVDAAAATAPGGPGAVG
jgi:serine protease